MKDEEKISILQDQMEKICKLADLYDVRFNEMLDIIIEVRPFVDGEIADKIDNFLSKKPLEETIEVDKILNG